MVWFPFVFIALGVLIGFLRLPGKFFALAESVGNIVLISMMFAIGVNIGASDTVIQNFGVIGLQCVVITCCAVIMSVFAVFALEKTVLPLNTLKEKMASKNLSVSSEVKTGGDLGKKSPPLAWIIPVFIFMGVFTGFFLPKNSAWLVDSVFDGSLAVLYVSVGVGLAQNRHVFFYVKLIGWKIALISAATVFGSLVGGLLAGVVLRIPLHISVLSACGMCYYSLTGAFMTQVYGINIGAYGFLVNVLRELMTILALPVFIRISQGAPIALGGAANMDTTLVPVTKYVGAELGLVALITGTILTFVVPLLLPLLSNIF